jgi:hypothetical protein
MTTEFLRRNRKRHYSAEELAYIKRVEKNKIKAQTKQAAIRRRLEYYERLRIRQEKAIINGAITLEYIEYGARIDARYRVYTQKRRAAKLVATPGWADSEKMFDVYLAAMMKEYETGIPHHVDHIVPLVSDIVCGLHCEANLQVLTQYENLAKNNRVWPDMP